MGLIRKLVIANLRSGIAMNERIQRVLDKTVSVLKNPEKVLPIAEAQAQGFREGTELAKEMLEGIKGGDDIFDAYFRHFAKVTEKALAKQGITVSVKFNGTEAVAFGHEHNIN
jgi:hypothetical protein